MISNRAARRVRPVLLLLATALAGALGWAALTDRLPGSLFGQAHAAEGALKGIFDGPDLARVALPVGLLAVAQDLREITDIQPIPGDKSRLAVLLKNGAAVTVTLPAPGARPAKPVPAFKIDVPTRSEQGLLGLAFHPKYAENHLFYLHHTVKTVDGQAGRIAEWRGPFGPDAKPLRVVLEVTQPYANHNGGQIAFGPDGKLYIGFGDGGAANDPQDNGQNHDTLLGAMLRIDVAAVEGEGTYAVPADNPFVDRAGYRPEIFAYGLRNPWRFGFAPDGRLIAADVGQNRFEEVTFVGHGQNLGWNRREADHCFEARPKSPTDAPCVDAEPADGLIDPIYAYPREDGVSITGGAVYTGADVPALRGRYVFGDFASGRLWAIDLPKPGATVRAADTRAQALGRFSMQISTFGVGHDGALYVGDFGGGVLYRVVVAP